MLAEKTLDSAAEEAVGNWLAFRDFAWNEQPDHSETYTLVYTHNRDSKLTAQSNAGYIDKALMPFADDVIPQCHRHWACGWFDGYAIRVYRNGAITEAFRVYYDLQERLADYPLLDEEDYSNRERNATLDNIRMEASYLKGGFVLPEDFAEQTYRWLWDNNDSEVENTDDEGAYPSSDALLAAWRALGFNQENATCAT